MPQITETTQEKDVVIVGIPLVESANPIAAPAVLKPIVERANLSCVAINANLKIYNKIKIHKYQKDFLDFYTAGKISKHIMEELFSDLNSIVDEILKHNPKWIGLSLLSRDVQNATEWILYLLKKRNTSAKIILGGNGCNVSANEPGNFIELMFKKNLIDYHISGDGEIALEQLLKGNTTYPGINGIPKAYLTDEQIDQLPYPDYSDYNLREYQDPLITLTGSRGCVRACTFCDYIEMHKHYQWRKGDKLYEEMLHQQQKYNCNKFAFADSLVNGNQKEFNILISKLADHNATLDSDKKIKWAGFYIFRNKSSGDDKLWKNISESGGSSLAVGIESFSQKIRYQIGKKFDDESIIHHLHLAKKYGVKILLLLLVGYPTETDEDKKICLDWIKHNKQFADTVTFSFSTMAIIPGTQLHGLANNLGIAMQDPNNIKQYRFWTTSKFQINNNMELREQWLKEYIAESRENGFSLDSDHSLLQKNYFSRLNVDPRDILENSI